MSLFNFLLLLESLNVCTAKNITILIFFEQYEEKNIAKRWKSVCHNIFCMVLLKKFGYHYKKTKQEAKIHFCGIEAKNSKCFLNEKH